MRMVGTREKKKIPIRWYVNRVRVRVAHPDNNELNRKKTELNGIRIHSAKFFFKFVRAN